MIFGLRVYAFRDIFLGVVLYLAGKYLNGSVAREFEFDLIHHQILVNSGYPLTGTFFIRLSPVFFTYVGV